MESIQIRIPKRILAEIDDLIEKKIFSSRSEIVREALRRYILEFRIFGTYPYIVGPFSQKEFSELKKFLENPQNLIVSKEKFREVKQLLES